MATQDGSIEGTVVKGEGNAARKRRAASKIVVLREIEASPEGSPRYEFEGQSPTVAKARENLVKNGSAGNFMIVCIRQRVSAATQTNLKLTVSK